MHPINVLFLWKVSDQLKRHFKKSLRKVKGVNLVFPEKADESELLKLSSNAQIIVGWRPSNELLDRAQELKLFIFPGAGVQHLVDWFRDPGAARGIVLVNGHGNSYFVAQHMIALLFALLNKIVLHHNWMVNGKWRKGDDDAKTMPLKGRRVGLLGYGAINQKVHHLLSSFDVNFAVLRRSWTKKIGPLPTPVKKYEPSQLTRFLDEVDTLLVAIPATPETNRLLGYEELKRLGPDGVVVNVGRGSIIDQTGLYRALEQTIIAGAAIDVWYTYQPEPDKSGRKYPFEYPFHKLDNIILSPHRAASPFDDLDRWNEVIENIQRFTQGRSDFLNIVDVIKGY